MYWQYRVSKPGGIAYGAALQILIEGVFEHDED